MSRTPADARAVVALAGFPAGIENDAEWGHLVNSLHQLGCDVNQLQSGSRLNSVTAVLVFNDQPAAVRKAREYGFDSSRLMRLVMEPRVTCPRAYRNGLRDQFGLTISMSEKWSEQLGGHWVAWPQRLKPSADHRSDGRTEPEFLLGLVAGNKASFVPGAMYSLRRRTLIVADRRGIPILVGGAGWNASIPRRVQSLARAAAICAKAGIVPRIKSGSRAWRAKPTYQVGFVESPADVYQRSRLSLVIENSADYVSEKLVDAIRFGSVPVYVGPRLSEFGLSDGIALECSPQPEAILQLAEEITEQELEECRRLGRDWLASLGASNMSTATVFSRVASIIANHVETLTGPGFLSRGFK